MRAYVSRHNTNIVIVEYIENVAKSLSRTQHKHTICAKLGVQLLNCLTNMPDKNRGQRDNLLCGQICSGHNGQNL